jgi:hypothetical protein
MMQRAIRSLIFAVVVAVALGLIPGATSAQNSGQDSVRGNFIVNLTEHWDIHAHANFNGTNPRGRVRLSLTVADPNIVLTGDVTCVEVSINPLTNLATATVGAVVTNIQGAAGVDIGSMLLFMTDSGKFAQAPDEFFGELLPETTPPDCLTALPGLEPVDGEIVIQDSQG